MWKITIGTEVKRLVVLFLCLGGHLWSRSGVRKTSCWPFFKACLCMNVCVLCRWRAVSRCWKSSLQTAWRACWMHWGECVWFYHSTGYYNETIVFFEEQKHCKWIWYYYTIQYLIPLLRQERFLYKTYLHYTCEPFFLLYRYTTRHLNDDSTSKQIRALLQWKMEVGMLTTQKDCHWTNQDVGEPPKAVYKSAMQLDLKLNKIF